MEYRNEESVNICHEGYRIWNKNGYGIFFFSDMVNIFFFFCMEKEIVFCCEKN